MNEAPRSVLLGLLIDVSGSMSSSLSNPHGPSRSRLDSVREAIREFANRGRSLTQNATVGRVAESMSVFGYGFGLDGPGSLLLRGPRVRDLLALANEPGTVPIAILADNWQAYERHIQHLALSMLGSTPMREALEVASTRFQQELSLAREPVMPVLFILSDGQPTDDQAGMIPRLVADLEQHGVLIVSCYVTDDDLVEPRHLYGAPQPDWPTGARLMFDCASILPTDSPFTEYLSSTQWLVESDARLFAQVNQSTVVNEFVNLLLSPLRPPAIPALSERADSLQRQLAQHERTLLLLEEQAAIYPVGTIPVHLLTQMEAEKTQISQLKTTLPAR